MAQVQAQYDETWGHLAQESREEIVAKCSHLCQLHSVSDILPPMFPSGSCSEEDIAELILWAEWQGGRWRNETIPAEQWPCLDAPHPLLEAWKTQPRGTQQQKGGGWRRYCQKAWEDNRSSSGKGKNSHATSKGKGKAHKGKGGGRAGAKAKGKGSQAPWPNVSQASAGVWTMPQQRTSWQAQAGMQYARQPVSYHEPWGSYAVNPYQNLYQSFAYDPSMCWAWQQPEQCMYFANGWTSGWTLGWSQGQMSSE